MKHVSLLTAASLLALIAATPAVAQMDPAGTSPRSEMSKDYVPEPTPSGALQPEADDSEVVKDIKQGLKDANAEIRETADEIKAWFMNESGGTFEPVTITRGMTAQGMIGEKVTTPTGENVAKVYDIVLEPNGTASKVVLSDGGLMGIGDKLAAFDYGRVITKSDDGKIVMRLSQDMIDRAADFSYDRDDYRKAEIMPVNSISVKDLLDGQVYDSAGKKVADIENLSIVDGDANRLIVGFNKILGIGGDVAALDFDTVQFVNEKGEVNARLTESQSRQFANFKKVSQK